MDSRPLKTSLLPITQSTLEDIKECIINLARARCITCLEDVVVRVGLLEQRPTELDPYMEYKTMIQQQIDSKKEVMKLVRWYRLYTAIETLSEETGSCASRFSGVHGTIVSTIVHCVLYLLQGCWYCICHRPNAVRYFSG